MGQLPGSKLVCGQKGSSQGDRQGAEFNPVLSGNGSELPNWNDCLVSGWGGGASVEEKEEGTGERGRAGEKKVSFSKSFF